MFFCAVAFVNISKPCMTLGHRMILLPMIVFLILFSHVQRDFNKQADALATEGVLAFGRVERGRWRTSDRATFLRVWFDGGCREGKMGAGVRLEAGCSLGLDGRPNWELVVGFGVKLVGGLGKNTIV